MKKNISLILFTLLWGLCLQAQNTLTVCNDSSYSEGIPMIGGWMDVQQHTQILYSDSMLTSMRGMQISSMKFYTHADYNSASWNATVNISMAIDSVYTNSTLDTFNAATLTTVYQGTLSVANHEMVINFNNDFVYPSTGGDLLIDFSTLGGTDYEDMYFLGRYDTTHSYLGFEYYGVMLNGCGDITPKLTFTYGTPSSCTRPQMLTVNSLAPSSLSFSWTEMGSASQWQYVYLTAPMDENSTLTPNTVGTDSVTLYSLTAGTTYYIYVRALCSATDQSMWSAPLTVTTPLCENPCEMMIYMADEYGDGWDGAFLVAEQGSLTSVFLLPYDNYEMTVSTSFCPTDSVHFYWSSGDYDDEISFSIFDADSNQLYSCDQCEPYDEELLLSYLPQCGNGCAIPTQVTASVNGNQLTVDWTAMNEESAWDVKVVNTDNNSQTVQTVLSHPYTCEIEANGASYAISVRARCDNDNHSEWSAAVNVTTDAPEDTTCFTPTNLSVDATSYGLPCTIDWTPQGDESAWELHIVEYSRDRDTIVTVNSHPYNYWFEHFSVNSIRVRAVCSEYNYSEWSDTVMYRLDHIGIASVDNDGIRLYPNPAQEHAVVAVEGMHGEMVVEMYDMSGRKMFSQNANCESDCQVKIDLGSLVQGTYMVRIKGNGINDVRRLIVR